MNNILDVKPVFQQDKNTRGFGGVDLHDGNVTISSIDKFVSEFNSTIEENESYSIHPVIKSYFVSVVYGEVIPKSKRLAQLFKGDSNTCNSKVVGAKYRGSEFLIHYNLTSNDVQYVIDSLEEIKRVLVGEFNGFINSELLSNIKAFDTLVSKYDLKLITSKTAFTQQLRDVQLIKKCYLHIEEFELGNSVISFYGIENIQELMDYYSIDAKDTKDNIIKATGELAQKIYRDAPFLVSMSISDIKETSEEIVKNRTASNRTIIEPTNEGVVGVIDTNIHHNQYFDEWVEVDDVFSRHGHYEAYDHGTQVISLIVDGANLNKDLDDGCGNFRVKLFPLIKQYGLNVFDFVKNIETIIEQNQSIKVWNLSIGTKSAIREDYVSIESEILDHLQEKYSILFIVSATNKEEGTGDRIGSPADSMNSLVVASVDNDGEPSAFTRVGPVLKKFHKPDLSYYGENLTTHVNGQDLNTSGTSLAAALVTRKVAYLMYNLNLSREVTKALLIDDAVGWRVDIEKDLLNSSGLGVLSKHIDDIINTDDDEIKFFIEGISTGYDTNLHNLPIPHENQKHYVKLKAVLTYFPKVDRYQGVDYTSSDLALQIGRTNGFTIKGIGKLDPHYAKEGELRTKARKWENTKVGIEKLSKKPIDINGNGYYGISLKSSERLSTDVSKVKFGLVVTLKSIDEKNRMVHFYRNCQQQGWVVNQVVAKQKLQLRDALNEQIEFED